MNSKSKIIPFARLEAISLCIRGTIVVTNGCFDILHAGHVDYLEAAKKLGDVLIVGIDSDTSVNRLKGKSRPINFEEDRAQLVAALTCVDFVTVFPGKAADFLATTLPDIWVKGGDYDINTLSGEEKMVVLHRGGRIEFIPLTPGKSTTAIIERMRG